MLLLYCMASEAGAPPAPLRGVDGAAVEHADEAGVRCYFSRLESLPARDAREQALGFHQVVSAVFRSATVVPFRFPTVLADEAALRRWLGERASAVARELQRLDGQVQMELRISAEAAAAPAGGRAYLEARRDELRHLGATAQRARDAAGDLIAEARERETQHGLRCYCLVRRADVAAFQQRVGALELEGARLLVSGPWPPTEFLAPDVVNA